MLRTSTPLLVLLAALGHTAAGPVRARAEPKVILDTATVTGVAANDGRTNSFLGIPYAEPPTGDLRFQVPKAVQPYNTNFSATDYGPSCIEQAQQAGEAGGIFDLPVPRGPFLAREPSEDCLSLNVVTPSDAAIGSELPVVVWIYGGGFQTGQTSIYNGGIIVKKSIDIGVPAIFVSMNYRGSAYGFLASQEVKDAGVGNLGLRDQRLALKWVQKYIRAFGGDPDKVTIWGESSGAISATLQMLSDGGEPGSKPPFRAAFLQSGGPVPVGDITDGQKYYDDLVRETGCTGRNDTLRCLRKVSNTTLIAAVNKSPSITGYQSLSLAWSPRVDGDFLTDNPLKLVQQHSFANIPFITGNCEDEATLFANSSTLNITEDWELADWLKTYWLPTAPNGTVEEVMTHYPQDPAVGSPYNTGDQYQLSPQYKRIASFMGDAVFEGPRRWHIQQKAKSQKAWTYQWSRPNPLLGPQFGIPHASDLVGFFAGFDIGLLDLYAYLLQFAANLDPNVGNANLLYWPEYEHEVGGGKNETMLRFNHYLSIIGTKELITDTYRATPIEYLTNVTLEHPL